MRWMWLIPWLLTSLVSGDIQHVSFPEHGYNNVWIFLTIEVGLRKGATIEVNLENLSPRNDTYFMILTQQQQFAWSRIEPLSLPGNRVNSYLTTYFRQVFYDKLNFTATVRLDLERYNFAIMNINKLPLKVHGNITTKYGDEYLRVQDEHLPDIYWAMMLLFLVTSVAYAVCLFTIWNRKRSPVHLFLLLLISSNVLVLFLQYCDRSVVSVYGQNSLLGDLLPQLLAKAQNILELLAFLLISLGWKVLRGQLNITEVRFAIGVSVISFYLGTFEVSCTSQASCSGYKLARYILHAMCFLVIIVVMNYNLQMIYSHIVESPASVDAGKFYQKHQAFKVFRWIFLAYITAPTLLLFVKISVIDWSNEWAFELLKQLFKYAITVTLIYTFKPGLTPLLVFELTRNLPVNNT